MHITYIICTYPKKVSHYKVIIIRIMYMKETIETLAGIATLVFGLATMILLVVAFN